MELVGESLNQKRHRINWKQDGLVRTFLEACLHETIKNGREGSSLKSQSWKKVGEELKNKHNFIVDQKQKARFPILKQMAPYPFRIQRNVVIACFAVHNFIRRCNIHDQLFMDYANDPTFIAEGQEETEGGDEDDTDARSFGTQNNAYMTNLRDQIANQLMSNVSN